MFLDNAKQPHVVNEQPTTQTRPRIQNKEKRSQQGEEKRKVLVSEVRHDEGAVVVDTAGWD